MKCKDMHMRKACRPDGGNALTGMGMDQASDHKSVPACCMFCKGMSRVSSASDRD